MAIKKTGTDGEGGDQGGDGDDASQAFTEADFDRKFNAAMSNRDKRLQKQMTDMIGPIMTALDDLRGQKAEAKPPVVDGEAGKGEKSQAQLEADARIKRLEDQLVAEKKAREDEKAERIKSEDKAKADRLSSTLATVLRDVGVANPTQAKAAQALLERDGRVVYDEDGAIKLKVQDKYGESLVDLKDGLNSWAKTEEGLVFLPPRQAAGSGAAGAARVPGKTPTNPKEAAKQKAREVLRSAFDTDVAVE